MHSLQLACCIILAFSLVGGFIPAAVKAADGGTYSGAGSLDCYVRLIIANAWTLYADPEAVRLAKEAASVSGEADAKNDGELRLRAAALFLEAYEKNWQAPYSYLAPALVLLRTRGDTAEKARRIGLELAQAMEDRAPHMPRATKYPPHYTEPPAALNDSVGVRIRSYLRVWAYAATSRSRENYDAVLRACNDIIAAEKANHDYIPKQFVPSPPVPGIPERVVSTWTNSQEHSASFGQAADWILRIYINDPEYHKTTTYLFASAIARAPERNRKEVLEAFFAYAEVCGMHDYPLNTAYSATLDLTFGYVRDRSFLEAQLRDEDRKERYPRILQEAASVQNRPSRLFSMLAFLFKETRTMPEKTARDILAAQLASMDKAFAFSGGIVPSFINIQDRKDYLVMPSIFADIHNLCQHVPSYWRAMTEIMLMRRFGQREGEEQWGDQAELLHAAEQGIARMPESGAAWYALGFVRLSDPQQVHRYKTEPVSNQDKEAYFNTFWPCFEEAINRNPDSGSIGSMASRLFEAMDAGRLPPEKSADAYLSLIEKQREPEGDGYCHPANSPLFFAYVRLALRSASPEKRALYLDKALTLESKPSPLSEGESAGEWDYVATQWLMSRALLRKAAQASDPEAAYAVFKEARTYTSLDEHIAWIADIFSFGDACGRGENMEPCTREESARLYAGLAFACTAYKNIEEEFPGWTGYPSALPDERNQRILGALGDYAEAVHATLIQGAAPEKEKTALIALRDTLLSEKPDTPTKPGSGSPIRAAGPFSENRSSNTENEVLWDTYVALARLAVNDNDPKLAEEQLLEAHKMCGGLGRFETDQELAPVLRRLVDQGALLKENKHRISLPGQP